MCMCVEFECVVFMWVSKRERERERDLYVCLLHVCTCNLLYYQYLKYYINFHLIFSYNISIVLLSDFCFLTEFLGHCSLRDKLRVQYLDQSVYKYTHRFIGSTSSEKMISSKISEDDSYSNYKSMDQPMFRWIFLEG